MGLYEQIRDIAKSKGYSVNKLEQELGFARSSINKFNKNKPSMDKIQQISDFLNVSVDYLMTGVQYEPRETTQPHTIAAHFDGDEYTEEELDKIKEFAAFVKNKRNK